MLKKILIGVLAFVILASIGLFFWARAIFTQENVRTTLAAQLSKSLGQPVTIGSIGAAIYPRVTVNLGDVAIGQPARIQVETLHVGTDVGALLSRRIEHAALRLSGARIELPLPEFAIASPASGEAPGSLPVEIVSIDEIVLSDVQVTSGGRTLRGDIEIVPQGRGFTVRRMTLEADNTAIDITGQINDLSGPTGELAVKTGSLNFDQLLAFVSDFVGGAGIGASTRTTPARSPQAAAAPGTSTSGAMNISVTLDADRASVGALSLEKLSGLARVTPDAITLDPIAFGVFGGSYKGTLVLTVGKTTDFKLNAALSDIDMAAAMTFAGSPDTITGRLSGTIDLSGRGLAAGSILNTARGTGRVDITNGIVKRLGLVRTVILATSGRTDPAPASAGVSSDEPFARLNATLAVANGSASTQDLRFESNDLLLAAAGNVRLDGSAIDLAGQAQLSDKLSQQAGRDLVRYTQNQGRVTLPVTIAGSAYAPRVRIDLASVAKRAIVNRATEEAQKGIKKGLGRLLGK